MILRHPRRTAIVLSLLAFCLYASSTPTFNVGYGDSDEFLTMGKTWGIAHPPGYPLYVTTLHIAMKLPIPGTTSTQRAHLVSGFSAAITLYFMTLLSFQLTKQHKQKKENKLIRIFAIGITTLTGATATLFWTYSQVAEKYLFTSLFISLILYISHTILHPRIKKAPLKNVFLLTFVFGLAFSHSQTLLFLIPFVLYVLYRIEIYKFPKQLLYITLSGILGFLVPLLILFLQSVSTSAVSWHTDSGLGNLFTFVSKNDFRGEIHAASADKVAYLPKSITLRQVIDGSLHYAIIMGNNYSWWIIIPVLISITHLWKKDKRLLIEISLPCILLGFIQASFLGWPTDLQNQSLVVRLYIMSIITIMPLLVIGINELFTRLLESTKILNVKNSMVISFIIGAACIPLVIASLNYSKVSLKRFDLTSKLYRHILDSVANDSIITCYSDKSCFSLLYEQTVNGIRSDVQIVTVSGYPRQTLHDINALRHFSYDKSPWQLYDVVTWNVDKKPVYAVDLSPEYYSYFGIAQGYMFYVPMGYFGQLTRQIPSSIPSYDSSITNAVLKSAINPNDYMQRLLIQSLEQIHFTNGSVFLAMGSRDAARVEVSNAVNLSYLLTAEDKKQALATRGKIESGITNPRFAPGNITVPVSDLLKKIPSLYQQKKESQVLKLALGAVTIDPSHVEARLELARVYAKLGNRYMSQTEYQNVLILDSKNSEAIDQLSKISQ